MTYEEARKFIDQSNQFGSKLGLGTITELLERLGNPQDKLKVIHVAGTNGKGSTTAFIATILASEGYKTGRYISPAVFSYRERIQISSKKNETDLIDTADYCTTEASAGQIRTDYITREGVCAAIEAIKPVCEAMTAEGLPHPTPFEIETAMAFLYFTWEKVDFAIVEVGLGGRLDATNVIRKPVCSVITSVSMDHMQYLGDTLGKIASEKAGIIKYGCPVTTSNKASEVTKVLNESCAEHNTALIIADAATAEHISTSPEGTEFIYQGQQYKISLLGSFQVSNAVLAIETAKVMNQSGFPISASSIRSGLLQTRWRGRFELVSRKPYLMIDGAHNEDAAIKLKDAVQEYFPRKRRIFIMGVLADKDHRKILEITAPLADVIITLTPANSRALTASRLAEEAEVYAKGAVICAETIDSAIDCAYKEAGKEDVIIAFGSLSYLGDLCRAISRKQLTMD